MADDAPVIGATLSHYRLLARLGEGGMGVVYRAHDSRLGRDVALKVLTPAAAADAGARAALVREARTASALNHPNVCTVFEVGDDGANVFVAMELLEGRTLRDVIPADGLAEETVLRHAAPLARALAHAHMRGVIHRDIKSRNVVITADGRAKLLDFGLARATSPETGDPALSATGMLSGTPPSLAPELFQGVRASESSDLWAFGVMLHEMCTGSLPFAGEHVAALMGAILHAPPPPLPARISPGLRELVARLLAKDPAQRPRSADEVAAALEALLPGASGAVPPAAPRRRRAVGPRLALLVAVFAAVLAAATDPFEWRERLGLGGRHPVHAIAVLPLVDRSPGATQAYFADGMTEQLIADLARLANLRVISRTSVMAFKDVHRPLAEIASALHVDAVIEGSVQQEGGTVRIQARLVDARDERQLWSGQFDRPLRDVLALQSDVAREVAEQVRAQLSRTERDRLANPPEVDPAAFDHYLRGRYELAHEHSGPAIAEFRAAIAVDPRYARAWAGLAHALVRAHTAGDSSADVVRGAALAAGTRAVELDGASAESFLALADAQATLAWDLPGAERTARRSAELAPGDAEAHHTLGLVLGAQGRLDECLAELRRARELDPLSAYYQWQAGQVLIYLRRFPEAVTDLGKTAALFPDFRRASRDLAWARLENGDVAGAVGALERIDPEGPLLARAYARAGRGADARRLLARLEPEAAARRVSATEVAAAFAALGERERALEWIRRAWDQRDRGLLAAPFDPAFDALRADPRFVALATRLPGTPRR